MEKKVESIISEVKLESKELYEFSYHAGKQDLLVDVLGIITVLCNMSSDIAEEDKENKQVSKILEILDTSMEKLADMLDGTVESLDKLNEEIMEKYEVEYNKNDNILEFMENKLIIHNKEMFLSDLQEALDNEFDEEAFGKGVI